MVAEFLKYGSAPQYHEMFVQDGTANAISLFRSNEEWKNGIVDVPKELLRVSLANPRSDRLAQYVNSFRQAGVTLPVIYPYFPCGEVSKFKVGTENAILRALCAWRRQSSQVTRV